VDPDGDRRSHRLERVPHDSDAGWGAGAVGAAADPPAAAVALSGDRCGQQPGVHEPADGAPRCSGICIPNDHL
jgi:hypothetical protein